MKKSDLQNSPVFKPKENDIQAYIISLKNNKLSEEMTNRCIKSLQNVNMCYNIWDAFDGTNGQDIIVPEKLRNKDYLSWIKLYNGHMSLSEISCFLSHFSLWIHCCTINEPIVILEHDAIMLKPYKFHRYPNSCYYLGNELQVNNSYVYDWSYAGFTDCPMVSYYMTGTHAYAIDPAAAKNLFTHAIKYGITEPVDKFIRMDRFTIVQDDLYAQNLPSESTISHLT